jgi:MFS family permease
VEDFSLRSKSYLYVLYGICFLGSAFGGVTATLMSSYLPVVLTDLAGHPEGDAHEAISAIMNSVYLLGMLVGGLSLGFFGDRFGRKPSVQLSILCIGLFTLLTSFAPSWQWVVVFRFLSGVGVGGVLVTTTILIAEEWPDKTRNIVLGILSITIPAGIFGAGLITYNINNWRTGFLVGVIPLLLAGIAQVALLESQRWKKSIPAQQSDNRTTSIFHPSIIYDLVIGCIIYGTMLIGLWAIFSWLPTWVQTMVHDSDGQKERGLSMMLFAIGGLVGGFSSGWVCNLVGIRQALMVCFVAVFTFSFLLFKLTTSLTLISYLEMAGIAVFFGMSQGVLNVYIPELFPTSVRSAATGFCFNIGRTFTAAAVFFVGWLVNFLGGYGNALFIFSFIFLAGLIATFFAKEKDLIKQSNYGIY